MRLKTIFLLVITILLTVVIMQNNDPVYFKVLFFTTRTSKLLMMLIVAIVAFVIGYLIGRPKRTILSKDYDHGYEERDDRTHDGSIKPKTDTLSDEDREYIS
jgi:uncharacterized protein HemY